MAPTSIANREEVVFVTHASRSITPRSLAALLGDWRAGQSAPAYAALARSLSVLVLDGRLPLACRLPSERELAAALDLSRTTVTAAYDALRAGGFLVSRRGSGSWTGLPPRHTVPGTGGFAPATAVGGTDDLIDMASAAPGAPAAAVIAAARDALLELPRHLDDDGYDPVGLLSLRAAIAERYRRRGLPTDPGQIMVTAGALHGLDLVLRLLAGPGDRVLTDAPTYPTALDAMRGAGARLVPVGLTGAGWNVDQLTAALRQTAPRLGYLIADFHSPTGHLMTDSERAEVVAAAGRAGTTLVVDESFVELCYDAEPLPPPVGSYDRDGRVITVGSLSKPFWGGLRVGWIRAGTELVRRLAATRAAADMASPVLEQLIAVRLLETADEVLPDRRRQFAERRDALAAALHRELPDWRFRLPRGGLALWVELDAPVSTALAVVAAQHGVRLAAGPRFGVDGTLERFLRLPFTQPPATLDAAAVRLGAARLRITGGAAAPSLVVA